MPTIAKKVWKLLGVAYLMLRKGISKGKILGDLNLMLKRGKMAGKLEAIQNLMYHHHSSSSNHLSFSCSNTPAHYPTFHLMMNKRKHSAPLDEDLVADIFTSATSSPGFGPTPMVRQLRDIEEDNHVDEAAQEFIAKFYKDLKKQNSRPYFGS